MLLLFILLQLLLLLVVVVLLYCPAAINAAGVAVSPPTFGIVRELTHPYLSEMYANSNGVCEVNNEP